MACPICIDSTHSEKFGSKTCYCGYRKWLPSCHPYRFESDSFNGREEHGEAPPRPSGIDIMELQEKVGTDKKDDRDALQGWGIKPHLWVQDNHMPSTSYSMSVEEKERFLKVLQKLRVPDGYGSNLSRCVNMKQRRLINLKSHDNHVLMQDILPVALSTTRKLFIGNRHGDMILESENTFNDDDDMLDMLQVGCGVAVMGLLEDSNIDEAQEPSKEAAKFYRLLEYYKEPLVVDGKKVSKYLRTLKSYVRNKARPEGSIARSYLADECLTFCSRYMDDMTTKFSRHSRNEDKDGNSQETSKRDLDLFIPRGRPLGKSTPYHLTHRELLAAENPTPRNIEKRHKAQFSEWVRNHVEHMYKEGLVDEELYYLVCGPLRSVRRYSGYIVNGFRFHTLDRQENRKTQNSGVMVHGDDLMDKEYYGVLRDIYELQYPGGNHMFVFKCDWYDVQHKGRGYKVDEFDITSVCSDLSLSTQEPFVLESQVEQVFYVPEPRENKWLAVIKTEPRDLYNIPEIDTDEAALAQVIDEEAVQQEEIRTSNVQTLYGNGENQYLATKHFTVESDPRVVKWIWQEEDKLSYENLEALEIEKLPTNEENPNEENPGGDQGFSNIGGTKRVYASNFMRRLDVVLTTYQAADPTPHEDNGNRPKKLRTKYMHERHVLDEAQRNDPNSSQGITVASATSVIKKRGRRGKYGSLALEKKTKGGQFKLDIEIPPYVLQAVGENARSLVNFCGYVVRTTALMDAGDWSKVFAKHGFNVVASEARLHAYYKECGDRHEERLENPPTDFPLSSWIACCETFNSDKFKKRSMQNSKNRRSDKWIKHSTGNLSFPETEYILTQHTTTDDGGVLRWTNDARSKEIHVRKSFKNLVYYSKDIDTTCVLGAKSGYIRGKGNGYRGSTKARLQEEQQMIMLKQQDQITHLKTELEASKKDMDEYKEEQKRIMAEMEKRFMQMINSNMKRMGFNGNDNDME
uniref:DUF4218 domain-containing protein n=1 Tax=Chenopodium quinoa TaxID=63459 RepID=A0A803N566_CHEQI